MFCMLGLESLDGVYGVALSLNPKPQTLNPSEQMLLRLVADGVEEMIPGPPSQLLAESSWDCSEIVASPNIPAPQHVTN